MTDKLYTHKDLASGRRVPRCQEPSVREVWSNWPRYHQCYNQARFPAGDPRWCKVHNPEEVKARDVAAKEKWDADWNRRRVEIWGPKFKAVLQQVADGHNDARRLAQELLDEFEKGRR